MFFKQKEKGEREIQIMIWSTRSDGKWRNEINSKKDEKQRAEKFENLNHTYESNSEKRFKTKTKLTI
jgi:hypothetical protein